MKPSRLSIISVEPFELFEFKIRSSQCDIIQYTPPHAVSIYIIMVQPYTENLHKPAPNGTEIKKKKNETRRLIVNFDDKPQSEIAFTRAS